MGAVDLEVTAAVADHLAFRGGAVAPVDDGGELPVLVVDAVVPEGADGAGVLGPLGGLELVRGRSQCRVPDHVEAAERQRQGVELPDESIT